MSSYRERDCHGLLLDRNAAAAIAHVAFCVGTNRGVLGQYVSMEHEIRSVFAPVRSRVTAVRGRGVA
jgi:hypothetical protein